MGGLRRGEGRVVGLRKHLRKQLGRMADVESVGRFMAQAKPNSSELRRCDMFLTGPGAMMTVVVLDG
jgi:hypothetical protein